MRPAEQFDAARRLIAAGVNDCAISRQLGVPRPTMQDWRRRPQIRPRDDEYIIALRRRSRLLGTPARRLLLLLGMYLGDGCISRCRQVWRLRITLDKKYPKIVDRCREAIDGLMPGQSASIAPQPTGCVVVSHYSKHWPCLFPQHAPGRKHLRPIGLEPWQEVLVQRATEQFIRGLIDSNGCRVVANDRGVRSVRYHFSNRSEDILGLFSGALDVLEIPWTRPSKHVIAIYRKAAVARLDDFVGPKS